MREVGLSDPLPTNAQVVPGWRLPSLEMGGQLLRFLSLRVPAVALLSSALSNLPLLLLAYVLRSEEVQPWVMLVGGYAVQATIVSGFFGIATIIALRYHTRPRLEPEAGAEPAAETDRLSLLVAAVLVATTAWVVSRAAAVIGLTAESIHLLGEWGVWEDLRHPGMLAGIGLLPAFLMLAAPVMELAAAAGLIGGFAASVLLYATRSSWLAGTCMAAVVLPAGLVLDAHISTQFLHSGCRLLGEWMDGREAKFAAELTAWVARYDVAVMPMLSALGWALAVAVAALALLFRLGRLHGGPDRTPVPEFPDPRQPSAPAWADLERG
jgi:hypothetical protein